MASSGHGMMARESQSLQFLQLGFSDRSIQNPQKYLFILPTGSRTGIQTPLIQTAVTVLKNGAPRQ